MIKEKCKYCEKDFEAHTFDQLSSMILIHVVSKHRDKVEIKEIKNNGK
jgi:hypothetical protein